MLALPALAMFLISLCYPVPSYGAGRALLRHSIHMEASADSKSEALNDASLEAKEESEIDLDGVEAVDLDRIDAKAIAETKKTPPDKPYSGEHSILEAQSNTIRMGRLEKEDSLRVEATDTNERNNFNDPDKGESGRPIPEAIPGKHQVLLSSWTPTPQDMKIEPDRVDDVQKADMDPENIVSETQAASYLSPRFVDAINMYDNPEQIGYATPQVSNADEVGISKRFSDFASNTRALMRLLCRKRTVIVAIVVVWQLVVLLVFAKLKSVPREDSMQQVPGGQVSSPTSEQNQYSSEDKHQIMKSAKSNEVTTVAELRFSVTADQLLKQKSDKFEIRRVSGQPCIRVTIDHASNPKPSLSLSTGTGANIETLISVAPANGIHGSDEYFKIFGQRREYCGTLELVKGGSMSNLFFGGQHIMSVAIEDPNGHGLAVYVYAADGHVLAGSDCIEGFWHLHVGKEVNDVMVLACALVTILFQSSW